MNLKRMLELFSSTYSVAKPFRGSFFLRKKPLGSCVFLYTNWRTAIATTLLGAAFAAASVPAHADSDDVHFFDDIRIAPNAPAHDAVCFFCSVDAEGEVNGDIVVFFGDVHIAGHANHDVVNFFGEVTADDNAQIGNDLVSFFGFVNLKKNVVVGRDMVSMLGAVDSDASVSFGHDHVEFPFWIALFPFVIIAGIVALIVRQVRESRWRRYMMQYPPPPFPPTR